MYYRTKGLVLRTAPYREADLMLTVLTADKGLVSAKAPGVRRSQSTLKGACQLLCYSEFVLFENKNLCTIREAECLEMFTGLRSDLEKLALASYFAQAAEVLSQDDSPRSQILPLCLNCMYALGRLSLPDVLVKAVFELRSIFTSGFLPQLQGCCVCGTPHPERFDIQNGTLVCLNCRTDGFKLPIRPGTLDAMRYLAACDDKKIFSFTLEPESVTELSEIAEAYFCTQLERGFSALDFYKTLHI